jgi:hypothetical protein
VTPGPYIVATKRDARSRKAEYADFSCHAVATLEKANAEVYRIAWAITKPALPLTLDPYRMRFEDPNSYRVPVTEVIAP